MADFYVRKNDQLAELAVTLKDDNGAVNISSATEVRFHMKNQVTGALKVNALGTLLDDGTEANRGRVKYSWVAADTDTVAKYFGEFQVTIGGKTYTFPNDKPGFTIEVTDQIA